MLASTPATMVNQKSELMGIPLDSSKHHPALAFGEQALDVVCADLQRTAGLWVE